MNLKNKRKKFLPQGFSVGWRGWRVGKRGANKGDLIRANGRSTATTVSKRGERKLVDLYTQKGGQGNMIWCSFGGKKPESLCRL